ncbi:MAG: hypothetical protein U0Q22_05185 [Acidimicrobiales bacterium]
MSRTRRTVVAVTVAGSLMTGAACTGPPPSAETIAGALSALWTMIVINWAAANDICFAPCLPVQPTP